MTDRRLVRTLACTLGALLLAGCGSQPPVQLDVAPAASTDELAPADEVPAAEEPVSPEEPVAPEEPAAAEEADAAEPITGAEQAPAGTSAQPSPLSPDPELVIDEDGCATDVTTGIVVACHDPGAGPDDD